MIISEYHDNSKISISISWGVGLGETKCREVWYSDISW